MAQKCKDKRLVGRREGIWELGCDSKRPISAEMFMGSAGPPQLGTPHSHISPEGQERILPSKFAKTQYTLRRSP